MRTLIENSFALSTSLIKKDLRLARDHKPGVRGIIDITFGNIKSAADYYFEYSGEFDYLIIHYGHLEQRIRLAESYLHYGFRSFFICECGRRVSKLFLPPNTVMFKCRHCHHLIYQSTTINRSSKHGLFFYRQSQILKLMGMRENMGRIFWRSRYTKRFVRWLDLCGRAGLTNEVMQANRLMADINSQ